MQGTHRFELGRLGTLLTTLNGVYLVETLALPLPGENEYDCAGLYGTTCGPPIPDWRHSLRLTWDMPIDVQVSLQWRYVESVTHEQNTRDETLDGPPGNDVVFGGELGSRSYFDLAGTWDVNETYSLRLGIINLLDQDPPLVDTLWQLFFSLTGMF